MKQALFSALRSVLIGAGGWLVGRGYVSESVMIEVVGAVMVLIPAGFGVWNKYSAERMTKLRERDAVMAGATVVSSFGSFPRAATVEEAQVVIKQHKTLTRVGDDITWT